LDAGQNAAAHVMQQAAEQAHQLQEQAQVAHARAREELDAELAQSREQVGSMRGALIQALRDLYDRIGASLYRCDRAGDQQQASPITEPAAAPAAPQDPQAGDESPAVTDEDDIGRILPTAPQVDAKLRHEEQQGEETAPESSTSVLEPDV